MKDVNACLAKTTEILREIEGAPTWVIPTSGGKDSRATAQTALHLIKKGLVKPPRHIVYPMADTLLEYDVFLEQAETGLEQIRLATEAMGIEAHAFLTHPLPQHDFWVEIIGYGLIPPNAKIRRCTDKLKIIPIRKVLQRRGWADAPVLLGVRWGESNRRDKMLSCTLGGECGPDYQYQMMSKSKRKDQVYTPIVHFEQCAVWDWITLFAPMDGFDNTGLIDVYGRNGDLRYGCWACPLIYNDTTGEFLARRNPKITEMIQFAQSNFRPGGASWKSTNRELIEGKNGLKDGRLSLAYRRRLYDWLMDFEVRHGVALLRPWQKLMIRTLLAWFDDLPDVQRGIQPLEMFASLGTSRIAARSIMDVPLKRADALSCMTLLDDEYHRNIAFDATILVIDGRGDSLYQGQARRRTFWRSPAGKAINVRDGVVT